MKFLSLFKSQKVKFVKIKLTQSGRLILIIALGFTLIGFWFGTNLIYLLSASLFALLITNIIFCSLNLKGIKIQRVCPSHVARGKWFTVKLKLRSTSLTKFSIRVTDGSFGENIPGEKLPLISRITRDEEVPLSYKKQIKARGVYRINKVIIESSFPFGLCSMERHIPLISEVVVYPEFYEAPGFAITYRGVKAEFANTTSSLPGTGGDFLQIREYQPGDNLKHIHWRATARTGKLMVKQLEKFTLSNFSIILDNSTGLILGLGEESNFEYAIKTAATIANRALSARYHVKLIFYDEGKREIRSVKAYGRLGSILDELARLQCSDEIKLEELVEKAIPEIEEESVAVFLLLTLTKDVTQKILSLTKAGVECVLILFDPRSFAAVVDKKIAEFYSIFSELMNQAAFYLRGSGMRIYMINQGESIPMALSSPYAFIGV